MDCPNCGATMRERDRAGVKIDFCAECKGVWLDRGELDKIIQIELSDSAADTPALERASSARDRSEGYRDERRDRDDEQRDRREAPKSKKRSFFESLTEMVGGGEMED